MHKSYYFSGQLSQGFVALLSGRMIQMVADGLLGLFLPIFLFTKLNYKIEHVLLYFGVSWLIYAILVPLGGQFLNRFGLRRALRMSVFAEAIFIGCLYFIDYSPVFFLSLSLLFRMFHLLLFWIPYHVDFARFTTKQDRGKEYSLILVSTTVMSIILPFVSGFLISRFGFGIVFLIGVIITLASYIPFMMLPSTHEKFSWGYLETYKHFCSKRNQKLVLAHMASGAENIVGMLIWPIFIWMLLQGEFLKVGAISTLISATTVILQLLMGSWTDKFDKRKLLKWGTWFYSVGWLVKALIATAFQVFIVGVYHSFSSVMMRTPFDSLTYEIAADQGHYVDEFTVIKEMAVQFGRLLMITLLVILLAFLSVKWAFLLAALATLAFNLIPEEELLDIKERIAIKEDLTEGKV